MQYYSLQKQSPNVDFRTAAITGQAPDKGLYFPMEIPKFTATQIENFKTLDKASLTSIEGVDAINVGASTLKIKNL